MPSPGLLRLLAEGCVACGVHLDTQAEQVRNGAVGVCPAEGGAAMEYVARELNRLAGCARERGQTLLSLADGLRGGE